MTAMQAIRSAVLPVVQGVVAQALSQQAQAETPRERSKRLKRERDARYRQNKAKRKPSINPDAAFPGVNPQVVGGYTVIGHPDNRPLTEEDARRQVTY